MKNEERSNETIEENIIKLKKDKIRHTDDRSDDSFEEIKRG